MTPTIRVDDEVYALLQQRGEAFVDTPNTVLRRILGLSDSDESTGHPVGRRGGRRGGHPGGLRREEPRGPRAGCRRPGARRASR